MDFIRAENLTFEYSRQDASGAELKTKAIDGISFTIEKGSFTAIIGQNGSGKSTLAKNMNGLLIPTQGKIYVDGMDTSLEENLWPVRQRVGMVFQNPDNQIVSAIVEDDVAFGPENLGIEPEEIRRRVDGALNSVEMNEYRKKAPHLLSGGQKQRIAIAGAIAMEPECIVFDEPTAVLTETETANLLAAIRRLAAQGIGIVFISHRLEEIISLSDRVTILRDGELVTTKDTKDITAAEIARLMVGRALALDRNESGRKVSDEVMLDVQHLRVNMPGERVQDVSFKVHKGEIVGIGGLAGQGKLGIANGIMGIYPADGRIVFKGKELRLNNTKDALKSDIAFVSEDRKGVGLLLNSPIDLNIAFTAMETEGKFLKKYGPIKLADKKGIRAHADKMIKDLDIRCTSAAQNTGALSGGNQQKVCVARALTQQPELLLVSEPTRGIDIGAKKLILDLLKSLAEEQGMTIVMTSSELAELRSICDRVLIICEGRVAGELKPEASDEEYGLMMSSAHVSKEKEA